MNSIQAVAMPQVIFDDVSVCTEEYHSEYFIAAPSCDYDSQNRFKNKRHHIGCLFCANAFAPCRSVAETNSKAKLLVPPQAMLAKRYEVAALRAKNMSIVFPRRTVFVAAKLKKMKSAAFRSFAN